jgi:hypothetical protein
VEIGNRAEVAAVIVAAAAALIALLALVISYLAWREARRSADAAELSASAAARSADVDEAALALARQAAEQQEADRREAEGPTFERVNGTVTGRKADVELRVVGGPGRVVFDVRADAPWCSGIASSDTGGVGQSIRYPPLNPGDCQRPV